jgi:hypothetical protein
MPLKPQQPRTDETPIDDETPDWLASFSSDTPETAEPVAATSTDEAPDWLASISSDTPETAAPVASASTDETPDWLASLSADSPETPEILTTDEEITLNKAFKTGSLGEIRLEETPDWLAGALDSQTWPQQPETTHLEPENETPFPVLEEENIDSILPADVPDWLSEFTPNETERQSTAERTTYEETEFDADIAPGNLPSWVQALRPVESVVSDENNLGDEEQIVPQNGPLAGYRAVLPAQANYFVGRKSPARAIKLQSDELQQSQAMLLETLVRNEDKAHPLQAKQKATSDRFLRWLISTILFAVVFIPSLFGTNLLPVPQSGTADMVSYIQILRNLNQSNPVLIVVDYQPSQAGEMEAIFTPVLNDLMIFGKPIAFVSTSSTGPVMVSRMMDRMSAEDFRHTYRINEQWVDLGYLPGDAAGIRSFANAPQQTLRFSGIGTSFWEAPVLANVRSLNDFSAILVVTDNPDTGRIWIEQTSPIVRESPILMVISAQAEPMLAPYYDSGQVQGLLTGINDGLTYEAERKVLGPAHLYWDAFGLGLIAIQTLILIGAFWSLVMGIRARRKKQEEAEE